MCTVTYIPQAEHNFILTSNRDEAPSRSPQNITRTEHGGVKLIFPRDAGAGGTWLAASEDSRVACLLNGAFEKHKHLPPYRRSRGLMVLDFFTYHSSPDFAHQYKFEGMEPFTFIMVGNDQLHELRWDEKQVHFKTLDTKEKHIWSSSTLYTKEVKERRKQWFEDWMRRRNDFGIKAIQDFHCCGGEKDEWNGLVMNRFNLVQTVSITNVIKGTERTEMIYNDLIRKTIKKRKLPLKPITV